MMHTKLALLLVVMFLSFAMPSKVRADIAPPAQPPGSSLQPGTETTQVRMLAETVTIDVQPGASEKSLGQAHVTADFTMHNTGDTPESMAVRFPIAATDGWSSINEIADLQIHVAGNPVATRRISGEDPYNSSAPVPWAAFDVTFRPGEDLAIRVEYTLQAGGEYPYIWFKYILSTGAGWKDSIGSADIIVRLPYDANVENALVEAADTSFGTTQGAVFDGRTIRWHYAELEPTSADNFEVNLVSAYAWKQLLAEQANVALHPQDGESWGRIGKLSKAMAFSSRGKGFRAGGDLDPGASRLYQQSLDAYAKAVTLLPNDALWHAGYADALAYHAYFEKFNGTDVSEEAVHALQEIRIALALAPNDPKVQEIATMIAGSFPDGMQTDGNAYDYPWLTATPTALQPTVPPTEVAQSIATVASEPAAATAAPIVQPTTQQLPTSSPKSSLPACGTALLLPLGLVVSAFARSAVKARRR
jgi:tetratricopeptide (TPR) repeat protein